MERERILAAAKTGLESGWGLIAVTEEIKKIGFKVSEKWVVGSKSSFLRLDCGELVFDNTSCSFHFRVRDEDGFGHTD